MDKKPDQNGKAKVIDFTKKKYANAVLSVYDKLEHEAKRQIEERRAETERSARNRL